jgi:hypothetical protein
MLCRGGVVTIHLPVALCFFADTNDLEFIASRVSLHNGNVLQWQIHNKNWRPIQRLFQLA